MSKLKEMLKKIEPTIKESFLKDGKFEMPTWFLEDSAAEIKQIIATPFNNEITKDVIAFFMKKHCAENDIARYIMAAESWFVHRKEKPDDNSLPPSECDDRMEAIIITGADRDTGETIFKVLKITRDGKDVRLDDGDLFSGTESVGGRFIEIFDKPTRH